MPEFEFIAREMTDNQVDVYVTTGFLSSWQGTMIMNTVVVEDKPPDVNDAETGTIYLVVLTNESV